MSEAIKLLAHKLQGNTRCDLCHRIVTQVYFATIGGMSYKFCSVAHVKAAAANFNSNKDKGHTPQEESSSEIRTPDEDGLD